MKNKEINSKIEYLKELIEILSDEYINELNNQLDNIIFRLEEILEDLGEIKIIEKIYLIDNDKNKEE